MRNMIDQMKYPNDNIGVMPFMLPDNKTFVFTTDVPTWLKFNPSDLSTQGLLNLKKNEIGNFNVGTTHLEHDLITGDLIGLGVEFGKSNTAVFYRYLKNLFI